MISLLLALTFAPWTHPLGFRPIVGWHRRASGNVHSQYVGRKRWTSEPLESAAWIAKGVRFADRATADPPNTTLMHLEKDALIVWAVIYSPLMAEKPIRLDLAKAKRYACCEATRIPAEYELTGSGPNRAYSVIVRIYFGSQPTQRLRTQAQLALNHLELPAAR